MSTIYIVTHKLVRGKFPYNYKIIGVGTCPIVNEYQYDNVGVNISDKNTSFCELTALYWLWKNSNDNIVGLVHYRRLFLNKSFPFSCKLLTEKNVTKFLENYDIILPSKTHLYSIKNGRKIKNITIQQQYNMNHYEKDLLIVEQIISKKYPNYLGSFKKIMSANSISLFNMFVCKKNLIDKYCNWLFDILFDAYNVIDITSYDTYQKRVFGFLAERLFNVWVINNNLRVKYLPIINTEENKFSQILKIDLKKVLGV